MMTTLSPGRKTCLFITAITLGRIVVAGSFGLGDAEALYWNYAQHLQASYLDHPPMIGWLIAIADRWFGPSVFGVRIVPIALFALTLAAGHTLAKRLWHSDEAGWMACVALAFTPASLIGGLAAAPDAPLALFWLLAALCLWEASQTEDPGVLMPSLAGCLIGLAFLSKHTGACLALGTILFCIRWGLVRKPGFWIGAVMCLAVSAPVLLWNAEHDWIQLSHRLVWSQAGAGFSLRNLGGLVGGQMLYIGPALIIYFFVLFQSLAVPTGKFPQMDLWGGRRGGSTDGPKVRAEGPPPKPGAPQKMVRENDSGWEKAVSLIFWISAPTLVVTYILCLWSPVAEPHWPYPGYLLLAVGASGVLDQTSRRVRALWKASLVYAFGAYALAHVVVLTPILPRLVPARFYEPRYDLANDLYGWPEAANAIRYEARTGDTVAAGHYTMCNQLAFALSGLGDPPVVCLSPEIDDFDLWGRGRTPRKGRVLFVSDNRYPEIPREFQDEKQGRPATVAIRSVEIRRGGRWVRKFRIRSMDMASAVGLSAVPRIGSSP